MKEHVWISKHMNILICIYIYIYIYIIIYIYCKNKIVKLTNLLVSTVARNSGSCNLFGRVDCYGYTCNYNLIIVISLSLCLMLSNRCTKN